ncbi:hypothetical protein OOK58_50475 [Streptomyces sp. NBC_01728]|uniref:hypothetical protein n=1 Tax=unclassified Streptomyces TaxID=2593676 RepID=UPI00224D5955|nr:MULTISPECIES: hypothetical protein [unclassified Streptomyces]MCX4460034.1 hypothetical protein [Streptomyces sp. NBC_01719]MCX4499393.1 hypothetical protein [Streptomyces sp. NBC_01728]
MCSNDARVPCGPCRTRSRTITRLEQQNVDLTASLEEREAELEAAREANRQLTRALNQRE